MSDETLPECRRLHTAGGTEEGRGAEILRARHTGTGAQPRFFSVSSEFRMEAGVTDHVWELEDVVGLLEK